MELAAQVARQHLRRKPPIGQPANDTATDGGRNWRARIDRSAANTSDANVGSAGNLPGLATAGDGLIDGVAPPRGTYVDVFV